LKEIKAKILDEDDKNLINNRILRVFFLLKP